MKQHQGKLLCKLFSGEPATYHFSTENTRDIEPNTPFCLLGATQLQNAAKIIYRMDQGHGLLDRFLVAILLALRPTPEQLDEACERLNEMAFEDLQPLFNAIIAAHINIVRVYQLDEHCETLHRDLQRDFATKVNEEILNGNMPPKSYREWLFACPSYHTSFHRNYTPTLQIQKSLSTSPRNSTKRL